MASFFDQVFGQVPQVPDLPVTDPIASLAQLMGGEIKDWPQIEQLSNLYESYMQQALNEAVPGFSDIIGAGTADTKALLTQALPEIKGQVPQDVLDQTMRDAAFTSLGSGTLGGPMGTALGARNLGLTSLQLQSQGANLEAAGANSAQMWEKIGSSMILPPSANLYTPQYFNDFLAKMRASEQAIAQQKANAAAAPNPGLQALNQWVEQIGGSIIGSLAGGPGAGSANYKTSWQGAGGNFGGGGAGSSWGGGQGQGFNWTGYNPSTGTTGGLNVGPWNIGGTSVPYLPTGMPSDVSTSGYYTGGSSPYIAPYNPAGTGGTQVNVAPAALSPISDPFNQGGYNTAGIQSLLQNWGI